MVLGLNFFFAGDLSFRFNQQAFINVRFFLYAYPGLQVTEGMKCPAHFRHTRP